ncbi:hypothetical protein BH09BAC6_BH09BAC6_09050 [soil metagenome]|jgi:hypothetical protein
MKYKIPSLLLLGAIVILLVNSCKKDTQTSLQALFTTGTWQLASVQVYHYTGNSQTSTDTLNTNCNLIQLFTFNKDKTCTYTYFDCLDQPTATGQWALTPNQLFLNATVTCKDTTAAGSSRPFINAQILDLGDYSMVLQTGDIQPNYSATKKRTIVRYGFIRQKVKP